MSASLSDAMLAISSLSRSVYSSSGNATFSASVIELQRAPDWYEIPKRLVIRSRSAGSAAQKLFPSYDTLPRAGSRSPIIERRSVLLPQPLAPMITNTRPRGTSKLTSRCTTVSP
ncbi:MAG: hypothetical protein P8Y07_06585 [Gemmatimonadales bacterium]